MSSEKVLFAPSCGRVESSGKGWWRVWRACECWSVKDLQVSTESALLCTQNPRPCGYRVHFVYGSTASSSTGLSKKRKD